MDADERRLRTGVYGYRYVDPVHGRWLNRDPIGERGGWNLYGFIQNNPLSAIDRNGHRKLLINFAFDSEKARDKAQRTSLFSSLSKIERWKAEVEKAIKCCCDLYKIACDVEVAYSVRIKLVEPKGAPEGATAGDVLRELPEQFDRDDGSVPVLVTTRDIAARAFAYSGGIVMDVAGNSPDTLAHELGHVAGYVGDEDSNKNGIPEHDKDPNSLMASGGIRAPGAKPTRQWCDKVSSLAR